MNEELKDELDEGQKAARVLVEHLLSMGAAYAKIPVVIADEAYEVAVRWKPLSESPQENTEDAELSADDPDLLALRVRLDGAIRKIIFGTVALCLLMAVGAGIHHLFK